MRKIPEWVGKTDDAAIPEKVMLRLWDEYKGHCEDCARKIMAGEKKHFDHRIRLLTAVAMQKAICRFYVYHVTRLTEPAYDQIADWVEVNPK
ncbi:hypothetical protein [Ochrobactrum sp. Marseille-Q0166]|uniref:hypothetical protein n=1 Tax=Ochrobactrum sp. Marseille-Q0166 TaxID=2761105 RepID=UPI001FFEEF1B|nr:hypothetical protein [Ochrobactrum sp. Marseille-Q0166]